MEENITILGTGGDSTVLGRQLRASGGFVLTTGQSQIHIDPGPGALAQLVKHHLHPRETTVVLTTHQHVGHAGDAAALIATMTHNGMDKRGMYVTNTFEDNLVPAKIRSWTERSLELAHGQRIGINDVEIRAVPLSHYDSNNIGLRIQTQTFLMGYISDTKYTPELALAFMDVNILLINCPYPHDLPEGDHLCTADVIKLVDKIKPEFVILSHFGAKMLSTDPLTQARLIHKETGIQTVAAKDGLRIAPTQQDIKRRQKTLDSYEG